MKILGIDTSNKIASVAVYDNNILLGEKFSEDQKTHSEKVLPLLDSLLKDLNISINDIDKFFSEKALNAISDGEKAYSIAFSSKTTPSDRIISGIKKHKKYTELSKYKELIFVAVNV